MSSVNWWNYSINHLREELRKRGLETYGAKPAMVKRLQNYEENYKRRMDALRSKQATTYKSGSGGDRKSSPPRSEYKVVDEWKSSDEGKNGVKSKDEKEVEKKAEEKKEEKKDENKEEPKKIEPKPEEKPPNYWGMTMTELREQSARKGLSAAGSKYDIIDRLKQYDDYQRRKRQGDAAAQKAEPPQKTPPTGAKAPAASPAAKMPAASPVAKAPGASPAANLPAASPAPKPPAVSPAAKTLTASPAAKVPVTSPAAKTPTASPAAKVPATSPAAKIPAASPAAEAPAAKTAAASPAAKTPAASPASKAPAASPAPKTPAASPVVKPTTTSSTGAEASAPGPAKQFGSGTTAAKAPAATLTAGPAAAKTAASKTATFQAPSPLTNEKKYVAMTFAQLKIECVNRRIEITGSKPDIIKRLVEHDKAKVTATATAATTPDAQQIITAPVTPTPAAPPASQPVAPPAAAKKVQTSFKYVQAKPMMMTKIVQSDLLLIDDPKLQEHRYYFSGEVVPYHAGSGRRKEWSNYKQLPDMTKDILPDFETDMKSKTLVVYPIAFKDMLDPALAKWKNNCKDFIVRFQDQTTVKKSMKGSVEMKFFTRSQVNEAKKEIQAWNQELKVETLAKDMDLDGALKKMEAKPKNLEPIVNRLLFLNKIAVNVKEGNIASKFLDAASVVIARDPTDLSSKGYGYVEYLSREDAEKAMRKVKPLDVDRCRIDVQLFNKLPSLVVDEMRGLVMSDVDRVKMAEAYTTALAQRIKSQGQSPAMAESLKKQIEKLEADLALDAAIRKKLGFTSLPEPAVFQTAQQRNAWNSGVFKDVDLGSVKQIWADPADAEAASKAAREAKEKTEREEKEAKEKAEREAKEKELKAAREAKNDGPPPAKQGRFDTSGRDAKDNKENRDSKPWERNRFGGREQDNKAPPSRFDVSSRPGQGEGKSDDLRRKEPFNARQGSQTDEAKQKSYVGSQKATAGGFQGNPPSLLGSGLRSAPQSTPLLGDRAPQGQQSSLLGQPKSVMGQYPGGGSAASGGRGGGILGAGRGRGEPPMRAGGPKPGLLMQPSQAPGLRHHQPGGAGSPMDIESDSRSDDGFRMKRQDRDDFGNRANRFDAGANRFGKQPSSRANIPGLMDSPVESGRFGSQADKKIFGSQGDNDYGRSGESFGKGRETSPFGQAQRGGSGGMGRGGQQAGVPSLFAAPPGQRSSLTETPPSRFGQGRDDDQYGGQRAEARGQFDTQRDAAGRGQSLLGQRDGSAFGNQRGGYDAGRTYPGARSEEGYGQKAFGQRATDGGDERMKSFGGEGRGRGRGITDNRARDASGTGRGYSRFGAQSKFDEGTSQYGPVGQSTPYTQQGSYDNDYTDPMDQPLQFRRTPGAKAPADFGAKSRDESAYPRYPGTTSAGDYQPYGGPREQDEYGDQEPWTDEYGNQYEGYEDQSETSMASLSRGVGAVFNQLRSKPPTTSAQQQPAGYGQGSFGQKSTQGPYGAVAVGAKSRFGQDPYGAAATTTSADPYGRPKPQDSLAGQRKSRFDQATKADTATKSSYSYSRFGTDPGKASDADDPYAAQRALIESMSAEPGPEGDAADDYYNAGMAAKYGAKGEREPYAGSLRAPPPPPPPPSKQPGYGGQSRAQSSYGAQSGAQSSYGAQSRSQSNYASQSGAQSTYGSQFGAQSSYGSQSTTKASGLPPWQAKDSGSKWGTGSKLKEAETVPLEDMSVDLLKELSSQVSDLRSQLQSENIPTDSPKGAQTTAAGDSKPQTTYRGGAVMYGDQDSQSAYGAGYGGYGAGYDQYGQSGGAGDQYEQESGQQAGYGQSGGAYGGYSGQSSQYGQQYRRF